ncbi:MAG: hypothetical protein J0M04_25130, partial [Verrucomicrobia bacterium]|nr:hypothetical protein [Verrucomicrobiota bacterium]
APQTVELFLNRATRLPGDRSAGGFFATDAGALTTALASSAVRIWIPDPAGTVTRGGVTYREAVPADNLSWQIVDRAVDFGSGPVSGALLEIATGGEPTLYTQWRNLHFADPADAANDAVSGPNANPSGDGVPNLMRYAIGIGPDDSAAGLLPKLVPAGNGFVYRFRYDPARTDLVYRVRASPDLTGWPATLFDTSADPIPPLDNGWLPVTLPPNLTGGQGQDPRMFVRLHIDLANP